LKNTSGDKSLSRDKTNKENVNPKLDIDKAGSSKMSEDDDVIIMPTGGNTDALLLIDEQINFDGSQMHPKASSTQLKDTVKKLVNEVQMSNQHVIISSLVWDVAKFKILKNYLIEKLSSSL